MTAVQGKRRLSTRGTAQHEAAVQTATERAFNDAVASAYDTVPREVDATPTEGFEPEPFLPYAGQEPEPFFNETPSEPFETEPEPDLPFYYHAWAPNLTVRRGRPEGFRFRGGIVRPRTEQQHANVRAYLKQVVPGRNPDRWMGDTPGFNRELRCPECGFFTSNLDVFDDHNQHTKHHLRIPDL